MAKDGVYMNIDISEAMETINALRSIHTQDEFKRLMYNAFKRTGNHVKTILKSDLPREYHVKPSWIASQVGAPRTELGCGAGVRCSIPIEGTRGSIGGMYKASGGAHGWNSVMRRYKIRAKIAKAGRSTLPSKMEHQGGFPPFRNLGSKLGNLTFTRTGKKTRTGKDAIVKVVGIGIPQMPMNRSKEDVQTDIMEMLMKRLEQEHKRILKGIGR